MSSRDSMQREGMGFWRTTGVLLTCASLAWLGWELFARWDDVRDLAHPPPVMPSLPADPAGRAHLIGELAASPAAPASLMALWRLSGDPNHFVRGQALEGLARAEEGARMDPRSAEHMKDVAYDDTDWNRRSACVLLVQFDAAAAVPSVVRLWGKTTNPNTRRALLEALKSHDSAKVRQSLERLSPDLLQALAKMK